MTSLQILTKGIDNFYEYQNNILTLQLFWKLHYIKQETIPKQLREPFKGGIGELKYGNQAVVHS